jgi:hypothetical protein
VHIERIGICLIAGFIDIKIVRFIVFQGLPLASDVEEVEDDSRRDISTKSVPWLIDNPEVEVGQRATQAKFFWNPEKMLDSALYLFYIPE